MKTAKTGQLPTMEEVQQGLDALIDLGLVESTGRYTRGPDGKLHSGWAIIGRRPSASDFDNEIRRSPVPHGVYRYRDRLGRSYEITFDDATLVAVEGPMGLVSPDDLDRPLIVAMLRELWHGIRGGILKPKSDASPPSSEPPATDRPGS